MIYQRRFDIDDAAEIGRNPVRKHKIQPKYGECQENRASRPPVVGHGLTFEYDCSN